MAGLVRRLEIQRIKNSWVDVTTLNGGAYLLSQLALSADQTWSGLTHIPWSAPVAASAPPRRAVYDQMLSGVRQGQGDFLFNWILSMLTFGMSNTLKALYSNVDRSQKVTVKTYDGTNTVRYFQAYMAPFAEWIASGTPVEGGWQNTTIPFSGGTEIT